MSGNNKSIWLWTERGALNHAKILNSDKAWDIYNMLVETYYRYKELVSTKPQDTIVLSQFSPQLQALINREIWQRQIEDRLDQVEQNIELLSELKKLIGRE